MGVAPAERHSRLLLYLPSKCVYFGRWLIFSYTLIQILRSEKHFQLSGYSWMYFELPQCVPVYFTFMLVHHLLHFSSSLEKITIDSSSVRMCSLKQRVDWLTILKEKRHVRTVFTTVRVVRYIQHANCTNTYVRSFFIEMYSVMKVQCKRSVSSNTTWQKSLILKIVAWHFTTPKMVFFYPSYSGAVMLFWFLSLFMLKSSCLGTSIF